MRTEDCYRLLGVSRYASQDALRRAFRLRLLAVHPDRNPQDLRATERTRRVIEAYRSLSGPLGAPERTSVTPSACEPDLVYRRGATAGFTDRAYRVITVLALMAVIVWITLGVVLEAFGGRRLVFRPNLAALSDRTQVRAVPVVIAPDMQDCLEWYCAQRYQFTLGARWAAREAIRVYEEAALRAEMHNQTDEAQFYRSAIDRVVRAQSQTFL